MFFIYYFINYLLKWTECYRMEILGMLEMQSLLGIVEVLGLHWMLKMHDWWNANYDENSRNKEKLRMLWILEIPMLKVW